MGRVHCGVGMRTDDELRDAARTLDYEMWMVHQTAAVLLRGLFGEGPMNNAVLESFGVHARNLVDFFYRATGKPDDVLAVDFFPGSTQWKPDPEALLTDVVRTSANKLLAHMTYGRQERKKGGWAIERIVLSLTGLWRKMVGEVDDRVRRVILEQPFLAALHAKIESSRRSGEDGTVAGAL